MKHLLLGNGIDIQFGGSAYTNSYIIKRIEYRARLDSYAEMFGYKMSKEDIIGLLKGFVSEANSIRVGNYDEYANDSESKEALKDFCNRYTLELFKPEEIMLEDWLFVVHMFLKKNSDLDEYRIAAVQGFERLLLDAIYNDGIIQDIYKRIPTSVTKYLKKFDSIYTLNYDNNIESLIGKPIFHLHGDFSVLADSENEKITLGYLRKHDGKTVYIENMRHCFCNALLNYSGKAKKNTILDCEKRNAVLEEMYEHFRDNPSALEELKQDNIDAYRQLKAKIEHPELKAASNYHYSDFAKIIGELHIIGLSPNNDAHLFDAIISNTNITKVVFYYKEKSQREYIESNFPKDRFECIDVEMLWGRLMCKTKNYNYSYQLPKEIDDFVKCFNALSMDNISTEQVINALRQISPNEMIRLCKLVKEDVLKRNPKNQPTTKDEFIKNNASIGYIALQQGILPTVLFLVCVMNFDYI